MRTRGTATAATFYTPQGAKRRRGRHEASGRPRATDAESMADTDARRDSSAYLPAGVRADPTLAAPTAACGCRAIARRPTWSQAPTPSWPRVPRERGRLRRAGRVVRWRLLLRPLGALPRRRDHEHRTAYWPAWSARASPASPSLWRPGRSPSAVVSTCPATEGRMVSRGSGGRRGRDPARRRVEQPSQPLGPGSAGRDPLRHSMAIAGDQSTPGPRGLIGAIIAGSASGLRRAHGARRGAGRRCFGSRRADPASGRRPDAGAPGVFAGATAADLARDGRDLAHALRRLVAGTSVDSSTARRPSASTRLCRWCRSTLAIQGSDQLIAIVMTCASAWMEAALPSRWGQRWVINDEAWKTHATTGGCWSHACSHSGSSHEARHRQPAHSCTACPISTPSATPARSRAPLARGLLGDCSTKIVYQQEVSEAPQTALELGLSTAERAQLPTCNAVKGSGELASAPSSCGMWRQRTSLNLRYQRPDVLNHALIVWFPACEPKLVHQHEARPCAIIMSLARTDQKAHADA